MTLFIHVLVHFIVVHSEKELLCASDIDEECSLPVTRGRGRHQKKTSKLLNYMCIVALNCS